MGNGLSKRRKARQQKKGDKKYRILPFIDDVKGTVDGSSSVALEAKDLDATELPEEKAKSAAPEESVEHDGDIDHVDLSLYEYPFENLVFEGGGTKGLAYCGAIQVLEELGIRSNIRRVAGTSIGAITAALLAVGFSSGKIREFMDENMKYIMLDHPLGYLSIVPNMVRHFGWNPGRRFRSWLGEKFLEARLPKTVTFKALLEHSGVELCIVVSNINLMTAEYFHAKTTPDMTILDSVYMSMSIPLLFQANRQDVHDIGYKDTYVDGAMFCSYPINCFDGWWLSMKREDSFMKKFVDLHDLPRMFENTSRFGDYNDKTLGFLLYGDMEKELLRDSLERTRAGTDRGEIPDTKRGRKFKQAMEEEHEKRKEKEEVAKACQALLNALQEHDNDDNSLISLDELRQALDVEDLKQHKHLLFKKGTAATAEDVMEEMDKNKDGQIEFTEIVAHLGRRGYCMNACLLGHGRRHVTNLKSFLVSMEKALIHNVQRLNVAEVDVKRTVGINTGHVGSTHFVLEKADKDYLVNQGRKSTAVFLRKYISENNPSKKKQTTSATTDTYTKQEIQVATATPTGDVTNNSTYSNDDTEIDMPLNAARNKNDDVSRNKNAGHKISDIYTSDVRVETDQTIDHETDTMSSDDVRISQVEDNDPSNHSVTPTAAFDDTNTSMEKETYSVTNNDNVKPNRNGTDYGSSDKTGSVKNTPQITCY